MAESIQPNNIPVFNSLGFIQILKSDDERWAKAMSHIVGALQANDMAMKEFKRQIVEDFGLKATKAVEINNGRSVIKVESRKTKTPADPLPRAWDLFGYVLSHRVRERVYAPCVEELKSDYLATRGKYRTPAAKRWLNFCFTTRTFFLWVNVLWVVAGEKLRKAALTSVGLLIGREGIDLFRERCTDCFGRLP